jgi:uncharacterized protein YnzC (UPF0291/DUF896 family)
MASNNHSTIWKRVIKPNKPDLPPAAAEAILKLKFESKDIDRMNTLGAKAREGKLTDKESEQLQEYMRIGNFLSLFHAKARLALKRRTPVA